MSLIADTAAAAVRARARIKDLITKTPLIASRAEADHSGLMFKADSFQKTGSFKIRGASAKMTALDSDKGLITASSGNHGIACSQAASLVGKALTVVLPETVATAKLDKIRSYGVDVILHGAESGAAEAYAAQLAQTRDLFYLSPYNDAEVIAGQGSIALELLEQHPKIDNLFVSMGGGGLISGIGAVFKAFSPSTKIIGVSAQNSAALAASMVAGKVVETEHLDTLADGVAGGVDEGSLTLPLAMAVIDQVVTCSEAEITAALRHMAFTENQLVEGAAALALAGYFQLAQAQNFQGQSNVVLLCGANFDHARLMTALTA